MNAIGTYRFVFAYSPDGPLTARRPIYGHRQQFLPIPNKTMTQVLIPVHGEMMWINVSPDDVQLN